MIVKYNMIFILHQIQYDALHQQNQYLSFLSLK
jgi:cell division protein FtsB